MGGISRRLLGISMDEVTFERRGFRRPAEPIRVHLEEIGRSFVTGYMAALDDGRPGPLARRLDEVAATYRGFAYEGAAMALALTDFFTPWRSPRLPVFLAGPAAPHTYLAHVGAGWALARAPLSITGLFRRLDPLWCWLAFDGWGFHQGFFHAAEALGEQRVPRRVERYGDGYGRRAFDQGLGRSLWFVEGAAVEPIAAVVAAFPAPRRGDLWSGVGLACAYAGGVERREVERLRDLSSPYRSEVAQGAAFAAKARRLAGNLVDATEMACRVLCARDAAAAAALTDAAARDLPPEGAPPAEDSGRAGPAFELWRRRIQRSLSEEERACTGAELLSGAVG